MYSPREICQITYTDMAISSFFVDLMYIFDIYISSNTCIHVSLLDYLSVYYMISCYYILVQSRAKIWTIE